MNDLAMDDLAHLLLQIEWGADEALEDAPLDRLRPVQAPPISLQPRPDADVRPVAAQDGTPAEKALRAATQAATLEALKAAISGFDGCPLKDMATNLVFAAGDPGTGVLLIGGAPGAEEDRAGLPFMGPEGALLDQMLASVGLTREEMLLTPILPWRPPGGRAPTPGEIQVCRPFLARLITLAAPERIVLFGPLAAATVLGAGARPRTIGWTEALVEGAARRVLVLPALADVMKTPVRRRDAWAGMRALRRSMGQAKGGLP